MTEKMSTSVRAIFRWAPGRYEIEASHMTRTRLLAARARGQLPSNRWTLGISDTVAAAGYWIGFLATLGADVLRDVMRSLRSAPRRGIMRVRFLRARMTALVHGIVHVLGIDSANSSFVLVGDRRQYVPDHRRGCLQPVHVRHPRLHRLGYEQQE